MIKDKYGREKWVLKVKKILKKLILVFLNKYYFYLFKSNLKYIHFFLNGYLFFKITFLFVISTIPIDK